MQPPGLCVSGVGTLFSLVFFLGNQQEDHHFGDFRGGSNPSSGPKGSQRTAGVWWSASFPPSVGVVFWGAKQRGFFFADVFLSQTKRIDIGLNVP